MLPIELAEPPPRGKLGTCYEARESDISSALFPGWPNPTTTHKYPSIMEYKEETHILITFWNLTLTKLSQDSCSISLVVMPEFLVPATIRGYFKRLVHCAA